MHKAKCREFWDAKDKAEYLHLDDRGELDIQETVKHYQAALNIAASIIPDFRKQSHD